MNLDIRLKIFSTRHTISISTRAIQYAIISLTVVISMGVAYWGNAKILLLPIAAISGLAVMLVLLRNLSLGYLLILLGGMFVPFRGPGGFNASILAIILLVFLWFMDLFIVKRKLEIVPSRALRPPLYFLLISIIAFGMGQISWYILARQPPLDAQVGGFAIYFFLVATMVATPGIIREIRWLKIVVWAFVALGTIYVLGRIAQLSVIDTIYQRGFYANSMFWTWLVALPLGQAIYNGRLKTGQRLLLYVVILATFYVALVQQNDWKSGWVPPAVAAAFLIGWRFRKVAIFSVPFVFLVAIYLAQSLIATDLYSWGTRVDAWLVVLDISRANPFFGLGFTNYLWYAPLFSIRGYRISFSSHSQFVDLLAQTGVLGFLCFLWIFVELVRLAWNLMNKVPDGFGRGYVYGTLAGIVGSLIAAFLVDWILPFAYNIGLEGVRASILPWIFFGGLVSVEQLYFTDKNSLS